MHSKSREISSSRQNINKITARQRDFVGIMMTSSNGNIFRVTGHLCGEFTGPRWIPHTKASDAELWCLLWSANKRLSKQSWGWWFEPQSRPLWRHRNVTHKNKVSSVQCLLIACIRATFSMWNLFAYRWFLIMFCPNDFIHYGGREFTKSRGTSECSVLHLDWCHIHHNGNNAVTRHLMWYRLLSHTPHCFEGVQIMFVNCPWAIQVWWWIFIIHSCIVRRHNTYSNRVTS